MASTRHFFHEHELGVIRFTGTVTGKDLVASSREFFSDARWRAGYRVLWEASTVERLILEPRDSAHFASARKDLGLRAGPGRSAVLANGFEVYASALILKVYTHQPFGREVRLCRHLHEAMAWLNLDLEPTELIALLERDGNPR